MRYLISSPPRGARAIQLAVLGLLLATAATVCAVVSQSGTAAQSLERGAAAAPDRDPRPRTDPAAALDPAPQELDGGSAGDADGLTEADGVLPRGVTVFDDRYAGIAQLRPELLQALQNAATEAQSQDVELVVNSGWRSAALQERLLRDAVSQYGSLEEASRWVATPQTSAHVSGDAVDIDGAEAPAWLSAYGSSYGLCQIYANEPWHYELVPGAASSGCPIMYADPTEDPRLRQ